MPSVKIPYGLQLAKKAALKSKFKKKPVGAAYINGSKIIVGANSLKTSPLSASTRFKRIHAEMTVLKKLEVPASGSLFIYRETKDGNLAMAKPCKACMDLIIKFRIKWIIYSTQSGFIKERLL